MTNEKKQEYTLKITQANRTGMLVLIYDIARSYIREAEEDLAVKDYPAFRRAISHTQNCVNQLIETLDFKYEISVNLLALYSYVNRELIKSMIHRSEEGLLEAEKTLKPLQEAFAQVALSDDSAPLMQHAQSVVAGMTYGKGMLNESLTGEAGRGFTA